jgi:hypothetical protein
MQKRVMLVMVALIQSVYAEVPYFPGTGWQVFSWRDPINNGHSRNGEGAFEFTVYAGQEAVLTVTDGGWNKEKIEIFNRNAYTGWTTPTPGPGRIWTTSYDTASASTQWSNGSWPLPPGTYKLAFGLGQWSTVDFDEPNIPIYRAAFKVSVVTTPDADGDGIADQFETGTGIFVSPVNTGTDPTKSDTDGDELSDWIEISKYSTDPNKPDTDGDGFRDLAEIVAGKSPTSSSDSPDMTMEIQTAVEVTFYTKTGTSYQVEWSEDLVSWTPLPEVIVGDGNPVHRMYSMGGVTKRFYRASKLPAP